MFNEIMTFEANSSSNRIAKSNNYNSVKLYLLRSRLIVLINIQPLPVNCKNVIRFEFRGLLSASPLIVIISNCIFYLNGLISTISLVFGRVYA